MKLSKYNFSVLSVLVLFVLCIIILNNSLMTSTAIDNSAFLKKYSHNLFPQGWGFFTRYPREQLTKCFIKEGNNYLDIIKQCTDVENAFGLDRACRAKHAELEVLINQVKDSLWISGRYPKKKLSLHFASETVLDSVKNIFHNPAIYGEVVLVKEDRLPWAWSRKSQILNPPIKYVKVFVTEY